MNSETDSDQSEVELDEIDEINRLNDAEFPISEDEDDDEVEDDESMEESEDDGSETGKGAWANSIAKILNTKHTGVLSKAQTNEEIERKKQKRKENTFEVVGAESGVKIKDEKPDEKSLKRALEKRKRREKQENKLRVFSLRLKPTITDLDRERGFRKIATRGVVQLFNAVKSQQSEIGEKIKNTKLESKREEIIRSSENKNKFLDKLMSGPRAKSSTVDYKVKKEESESSDEEEVPKSTWSALRDDFMTGKKIGWDKDDSEEEMEAEESEEDD